MCIPDYFNNLNHDINGKVIGIPEEYTLPGIPAEINIEIISKSKLWTTLIAEKLEHVGTLCVEFFIDINDNLYVNEIAPRVHNSGHLTINAYNVSQFENHIRAVCSLKRIKLNKISDAEMINLIGNQIFAYRNMDDETK